MHVARPFLVKRSWILLAAMLLGMAVAPFPQPPASASCAAPFLDAPQRLVLERGTTTTVKGRAFVDGCQDSESCSAVPGCSHCESTDPAPEPMEDVRLRLRQGDRTWKLATASAQGDGGRVTWTFEPPAGVRPGQARLLADQAGLLRIRIR